MREARSLEPPAAPPARELRPPPAAARGPVRAGSVAGRRADDRLGTVLARAVAERAATGGPVLARQFTGDWYVGGNAELAALNTQATRLGATNALVEQAWQALHVKPYALQPRIGGMRRDGAGHTGPIAWADVAGRTAALQQRVTTSLELLVAVQTATWGLSAARRNAMTAYATSAPQLPALLAHLGNHADVGDLFVCAQDAGAPPDFVAEFVRRCIANNWAIARVRNFFTEMRGGAGFTQYQQQVAVHAAYNAQLALQAGGMAMVLGPPPAALPPAPAAPLAADYADVWAHYDRFFAAGNTTVAANALPAAPGDGPPHTPRLPDITISMPTPLAYYVGQAPAGAQFVLHINDGDVAHWKAGHTFDRYALSRPNANRSPESSMWIENTTNAAIEADARAAVKKVAAAWAPQMNAAAQRVTSSDVRVGRYEYFLAANRTAAGDYRLTQFYPTSGGYAIGKRTLKGIIALWE